VSGAGEDRGLVVGVTGASSDLGRLLLPRLAADPRVSRIVAFDVAAPAPVPKLEVLKIDLTRPGSEPALIETFRSFGLDALYHLAFLSSRVRGASFAHELEVIGSMHVLAAAGATALPRLIVASTTALYGARTDAPGILVEEQPLRGPRASRFIHDKIEVERQLESFRQRHPETQVAVLRFAPIVGPDVDNPISRWLRTKVFPLPLGFDPLWQVVHQDDAATALIQALTSTAEGPFNIACDEVLPLSAVVRQAGGVAVPVPGTVLEGVLEVMSRAGLPTAQPSLLEYLRHSWVADVARAREVLGFVPRYTALAALRTTRGA